MDWNIRPVLYRYFHTTFGRQYFVWNNFRSAFEFNSIWDIWDYYLANDLLDISYREDNSDYCLKCYRVNSNKEFQSCKHKGTNEFLISAHAIFWNSLLKTIWILFSRFLANRHHKNNITLLRYICYHKGDVLNVKRN